MLAKPEAPLGIEDLKSVPAPVLELEVQEPEAE
jgi:hypothetical protein